MSRIRSSESDYSGHAKTAAAAKLKAQLSQYLARVKAGEEILVTERDVPVARIVPVERGAGDARLRELERQGVVRLGSGKLPRNFWKLPRGRDSKASVRSAVAEERESGWQVLGYLGHRAAVRVGACDARRASHRVRATRTECVSAFARRRRAADAFQLAAALVWSRGETRACTVVSFDERLRAAAEREGFLVLPDPPGARTRTWAGAPGRFR